MYVWSLPECSFADQSKTLLLNNEVGHESCYVKYSVQNNKGNVKISKHN